MRTTETHEAGLIARIVAGEKELFHELIRPYERMVYLTLFAIVKTHVHPERMRFSEEKCPVFSGVCGGLAVFCACLHAPSRWAVRLANGYPGPAANHGRQDSAGGCAGNYPP